MSEEPNRLKELGVPNSEMSELLMFLVKPVQDVDQKVEGIKKQFEERIAHAMRLIDNVMLKLDSASSNINKIATKPDKHEHRISAVEGAAKHVEPLMDDVKRLDSDLKTFIGKLEDLMGEIKQHGAALDRDRDLIKENADRLQLLERKHADLHTSFDDERRTRDIQYDDAKLFKVKIAQNLVDQQKSLSRDIDALKAEMKRFVTHIDGINRKSEQQWANTQEMGNNIRKEVNRKVDNQGEEFKQSTDQIGAMREMVDAKLYRDDDKMEAMSKSIEYLEKRSDKIAMAIKEVKAEVGI